MPAQNVWCGGVLHIDGHRMHRGAFCVLSDNMPLWLPQEYRGQNVEIPTVVGEAPRKRVLGPARHTIELIIASDTTAEGGEYTGEPDHGISHVVMWLMENITGLPDNEWTTRTATVVRGADMADVSGEVQVGPLVPGQKVQGFGLSTRYSMGMKATFDLIIPGGYLK